MTILCREVNLSGGSSSTLLSFLRSCLSVCVCTIATIQYPATFLFRSLNLAVNIVFSLCTHSVRRVAKLNDKLLCYSNTFDS